ncbi:MAG: hypothetical protein IPJ16_08340 [Bacteroidales bacterium]|nr:hypothetical protein [Bacteroidales bacterium]
MRDEELGIGKGSGMRDQDQVRGQGSGINPDEVWEEKPVPCFLFPVPCSLFSSPPKATFHYKSVIYPT